MILVEFGYVQQFTDSDGDRSFQKLLFLDIIKLENQIPLEEVRRALQIRDFDAVQGDVDLDKHYVKQFCHILIQRVGSSLPGFYGKLSHSASIPFELLEDCDHVLAWMCNLMQRRPTVRPDLTTSLVGALNDQSISCYKVIVDYFTGMGLSEPSLLRYLRFSWILLALLDVILGLFFLTPGGLIFVVALLSDLLFDRLLFDRRGHSRRTKMSPAMTSQVHKLRTIPSATKLRDVGVQFKGITLENIRLQNSVSGVDLVPKFKLGVIGVTLHIPSFNIQNFTELLWRNMIAYEMKEEVASEFVYFMQFMGELINTKEDVQLLRNGFPSVIRQSFLDDDKQVVDLFSSLLHHYQVKDSAPLTHWSELRICIKEYFYGGGRQAFYKSFAIFTEPYEENHFLYVSLLFAFSLGVLQFCYIVFNVANILFGKKKCICLEGE